MGRGILNSLVAYFVHLYFQCTVMYEKDRFKIFSPYNIYSIPPLSFYCELDINKAQSSLYYFFPVFGIEVWHYLFLSHNINMQRINLTFTLLEIVDVVQNVGSTEEFVKS